MADPVASGITIIDTVRKGLRKARELYEAPQELSAFQEEVDQLDGLIKDIANDSDEHLKTSVNAMKACLREIDELIQYSLIRDRPGGVKARRVAWLRKREQVDNLRFKLNCCKTNIILAASSGQVDTAKRSILKLENLEEEMRIVRMTLQDLQLCHALPSAEQENRDMLSKAKTLHERYWADQTLRMEASIAHFEARIADLTRLHSLLLDAPQLRGNLPSYVEAKTLTNNHSLRDPGNRLAPDGDGPSWGSFRGPSDQVLSHMGMEPELRLHNNGPVPALLRNVASLMQRCRSEHLRSCGDSWGASKDSNFAPARLLYVGAGNNCIHIVESPRRDARYTCLSYCWGADPKVGPPLTTMSSYENRRENLPWELLPPLFRDAILVTRSLGMKYIWIDSLCIKHDDAFDWSHECSSVSEIYGNASLTIAASASRNPSNGMLPLAALSTDLAESEIGVHFSENATSREIAEYLRSDSPLQHRAWAFQERALSRRVLHLLGGLDAVFECGEGFALVNDRICSQATEPWELLTNIRSVLLPECSKHTALQIWSRIVEEYSSKALSVPSDKLVAISGVAKFYAHSLGSYAAGMWLDHRLVETLAWQAVEHAPCSSVYVAPSWSWASMSRGVKMLSPASLAPLADVVQCDLCLANRDSAFGRLLSGSLILASQVLDASVETVQEFDDQTLVHLRLDGGRILVAETDRSEETLLVKSAAKILSLAKDIDGNLICLFLSVLDSESVCRRVGLMKLYRSRREDRWMDQADRQQVTII